MAEEDRGAYLLLSCFGPFWEGWLNMSFTLSKSWSLHESSTKFATHMVANELRHVLRSETASSSWAVDGGGWTFFSTNSSWVYPRRLEKIQEIHKDRNSESLLYDARISTVFSGSPPLESSSELSTSLWRLLNQRVISR